MTAANTDHTDLSAALSGGVVHEDVMDKIWLIDDYKLDFTPMCSKGTHGNQYVEYTTDELGDAQTDNAHIDGADIDQNDAVVTERMGNWTQTSVKEIQISHRSQASNSVGDVGTMQYQLRRGQQRLRRDVEAQMLSAQSSVAGDGSAVAGVSAGLGAWIKTNVIGGAGFVAGGFNTGTNLVDAPTFGTAEAITETKIRDVAQMIYEAGGDCQYLLCTPAVSRIISEYMFTSSARIATMTNQDTSGTDPMTSYGSTNVLVLDHGQTVKIIPCRLQPQTSAGTVSAAYFVDPKFVQQSMLRGYRAERLGKTGLSEKMLISVDYSLLVTSEKALGAIHDIDETAVMTA